jgi:hypothetical protein
VNEDWILRAMDQAVVQTEMHNSERGASAASAKNVQLREARDAVAKMLGQPAKYS